MTQRDRTTDFACHRPSHSETGDSLAAAGIEVVMGRPDRLTSPSLSPTRAKRTQVDSGTVNHR